MRALLLAGVVVLYAVSIPWYREPGSAPGTWLGLPDWVAVALGCYALAAVLNAWAWLRTDVADPEEDALDAHADAALDDLEDAALDAHADAAAADPEDRA